jgi:collagenase-like PrtC family protease
MRKPEILAPVGNLNSLYMAIKSGADAVYLGSMWNARMRSKGFSSEELKKIISYAHSHNCKVYITLNVLMFNNELQNALNFAVDMWNYGADAFIVQDLGLAKILLDNIPEVELHASTQMSVHTTAHAKYLKELGFKRIVLARELSIERIKKIYEETGIEVEVFVHGAMCYSFSGKCLFSFYNMNRSGNPGVCAQLCRLPFEKYEKGLCVDKGYLTSLKDMFVDKEILNELKFVSTLKIEGRYKSSSYVGDVVSYYKDLLNEKEPFPLKFHSLRGYSKGYYKPDNIEKVNKEKAKFSDTENLGEIVKINKGSLVIKLNDYLSEGDLIQIGSLKIKIPKNSIMNNHLHLEGNYKSNVSIKSKIKLIKRKSFGDFLKEVKPKKIRNIKSNELKIKKIPKGENYSMNYFDNKNETDVSYYFKIHKEKIVLLPRVIFDDEIDEVKEWIKQNEIKKIMVSDPGQVLIFRDCVDFVAYGPHGNVTNYFSYKLIKKIVDAVLVSFEYLGDEGAKLICDYNELMITMHPFEVKEDSYTFIKDPKGNKIIVVKDFLGRRIFLQKNKGI